MGIKIQTAKVYFSPTKNRRYLSRLAAIKAEAKAIIFARYPSERPEHIEGRMTYPGYSIAYDEPERYQKMLRRMCRIVAKHITD